MEEKNPNPEIMEEDFPIAFTKIKEGEQKLEETQPPDWMNAEIKTREVEISNDDRPKIAKIRDYWSEEQFVDITNLLKEYRDVFVRDYKDLRGLVQEMGEIKIDLLHDAKPIKK